MPSEPNFSRCPVIDFSLASSPSTKPHFLSQLRHALVHVGFLYLSNHPIPESVINSYVSYIPRLFNLPMEEKRKLDVTNSPHFYGYVGIATEREPGFEEPNYREVFEAGTRFQPMWKEGGETEGIKDYWRVFGPGQVWQITTLSSRWYTDIQHASGQTTLSYQDFEKLQSNILIS